MLAAPAWRRLVGRGTKADTASRDGHQTRAATGQLEAAGRRAHVHAGRAARPGAQDAGFDDVRVSGEELVANAYGWMLRTLEARVEPETRAARAGTFAFRSYLALQRLDARLLEPRLPAEPLLQPAALGPQTRLRPAAAVVHLRRVASEPLNDFPLFPLPIVLLPSEVVPLHIFEDRYKAMIAHCLDERRRVRHRVARRRRAEGGRLHAPRSPRCSSGWTDGRMNILVRGSHPFRLLERQEDHAYPAGTVELLDDRSADDVEDRGRRARRASATPTCSSSITDERPEAAALAELSAYEMAASVEIDPQRQAGPARAALRAGAPAPARAAVQGRRCERLERAPRRSPSARARATAKVSSART